jgi:hypothetical protein
MKRTLKPDVTMSKKHPELRIPAINVAHSLSAVMLDKTIFQGVKPLRGQSHIRTFGTAKHDINNMRMLVPIDYGGAMETYKSQMDAKSKMKPIKNKKIPNCSDRIERLLTQLSDGDESTFNNLVDLLQLRTGLSKQRFHFDDCDVLEALNRHYRKTPDQLQLIEDIYQTS